MQGLMLRLTVLFVGLVLALMPVQVPAQSESAAELPAEPATESATPASAESAPRESAATTETIPVAPIADKPAPRMASVEDGPSDNASQLDTIEVTATRRVKTTRNLAGSVDALRGEDLEKIGAQSLEDYIKLVPGVTYNKAQADRGIIVIRGITTTILPGFTQSTTGIFLDDMPLSDAIFPQGFPDPNPFDLERVEILKGPQGTLFGAGALSGAIRYITQKPNLSVWQAKLLASGTTYGDESEGISPYVAGALNVPLGDTAALRGALLYRKDNGRIDVDASQRHEKDVDKLKQITGRVLGTWTPIEKLKLDTLYFSQNSQQADFPNTDQTRRYERSTTPFASPRDSKFQGTNFSATYEFDWASLLSTSNFIRKKNYIKTESSRAAGEGTGGTDNPDGGEGGTGGVGLEDSTTTPVIEASNDTANKIFAQELRLTSSGEGNWEWLAGAAYLRNQQDLLQTAQLLPLVSGAVGMAFAPLSPIFPLPLPVANFTGARDTEFLVAEVHHVAEETAVFGEATRLLGERWELTAGARLFQTTLVGENTFAGPQALLLFNEIEHTDQSDVKESGFNPKFSVRYSLNQNIQTYILASKGFQFGGVQLNPPNLTFSTTAGPNGFFPYKSSKLWNYEWGIKTEWWDRRLQFDVTFFYLSWQDLQLTAIATDPAGQDIGLFSYIVNVGHAHSDGAEVAFRVLPFEGMSFTSTMAFINARTDTTFTNSDGTTVPPGTRLPGTPKFQNANVIAYERPFSLLGNWSAGISLTHAHTGKSFNDLNQVAELGGYDTLDARIHLQNTTWDAQPDISLSLNNFTDVRGVAGVATSKGARQRDFYLINPRTLLLSFAIRY